MAVTSHGKRPHKKRRGHGDTRVEGSHIKMGTDVAVMLPQAKEYLGPPEAGRDKGGLFPNNSQGSMALPTL